MLKRHFRLEELIQNESFRRWTEGEVSPQERTFWDGWVSENAENRNKARKAQQRLLEFSFKVTPVPDSTKTWSRISQQVDKGRRRPYSRIRGTARNFGGKWLLRVAAGILIMIAVGWTYFAATTGEMTGRKQLDRKEIATDYGEQKKITLSDGSAIVLNAHSTLDYSVDPARPTKIEVFLEGEAYFFVAKRNRSGESPFHVRTADGIVSVLGTRFVVSTRNRNTQVVLEEGRVAIEPVKAKASGKSIQTILKPDELAVFDRSTDTVRVKPANSLVYTSWTTKKLVFDRTPLPEVMERLEHTFGVEVIIYNNELYKRTISGSVENAGLTVITSALSKALNIPIKVTNKTVYVGNSRIN